MKYLITGARGMLGHDIQAALAGRDVTALGRDELDITDFDAVSEAMDGHDVIINTAAYSRVDDAETNEDEAFEVNATGPENLAIAASLTGARLVQVSTDYVFDGTAKSPYKESAALHPISAYGRTKAAGEQRVLSIHGDGTYVVRTAWLYGAGGPNFAKTMLLLAEDRQTIEVVDDQFGQPTWSADLARQIVALVDSAAPAGVYHGTNSGECTWFSFARQVFELAGLDPKRIVPTTSASFIRPARRPQYSVLAHDKWSTVGLSEMRDWKLALADAFESVAVTP